MARSEIIVGVDIGTTKVCTVVGEAAGPPSNGWRAPPAAESLSGSWGPRSAAVENTLEILAVGVEGKLALWQASQHAGHHGLPQAELEALVKRARSQRRRL